jgi:ornithine carbamoyltransferase
VITLAESIRPTDRVFAQEVDGELVIYDRASEAYFGLDGVGAAIWQAMGPGAPLETIHAALLEQYEVTAEVMERDLLAFVEQLIGRGLVERILRR